MKTIINFLKKEKFPQKDFVVTFDKNIIKCQRPNGVIESVKWNELQAVIIETNDHGPFESDVFWILVGENNNGCVFPSESIGASEILKEMQEILSGFNNENVIEAMACCTNKKFLIWSLNND